jgi:hypothetical protein
MAIETLDPSKLAKSTAVPTTAASTSALDHGRERMARSTTPVTDALRSISGDLDVATDRVIERHQRRRGWLARLFGR